MDLNVEIQGQGYPILCLHGHPGSSASMSVFTNHLAQQYLTIAPDLRGYGKSRPRGDFQMNDHIDDLIALLDTHQIEKCLLLGWSLGGIISLELVLNFPTRFSGLILIASAAHPRGNHPAVTKKDLLFTAIAGIINRLKPGWEWNINTFGKRSLFRYLVNQQTSQAYQYLAKEGVPAFWQTSAAANRALSQAMAKGYNCTNSLKDIDIPSLILAGEGDRHITPIASQETAHKLKNSQFSSYPQTAHLFPWEIPDLVLSDIDLWLSHYPEIVKTA